MSYNVNESRLTTDELMNVLLEERNPTGFLRSNNTEIGLPSFREYLEKLRHAKGESAEKIVLRGNIEKSYGHQIFRGVRKPSRDTVIKLAFGFEMDVEDAQKMLRTAGMSMLYPRVLRDAVVIYSLHNHISVIDTEIILQQLDLPLLSRDGSL